jgi:hypothetical protein
MKSRERGRNSLKGDLILLKGGSLGVEVDDGEGVAAGYGLNPAALNLGGLLTRGRSSIGVLRHCYDK